MQTRKEVLEAKLRGANRGVRHYVTNLQYGVRFSGDGPCLVYSDMFFEYHVDEIGEGVRGARSCGPLKIFSFSAPGDFAKGTLSFLPPEQGRWRNSRKECPFLLLSGSV